MKSGCIIAMLSLFALSACTDNDDVASETIVTKINSEVSSSQEPFSCCYMESMPVYLGGENAMMQFINDNLRYPSELNELCIQGCIIVKFVVEKDGTLADIHVIRGLHPLLDAEAVRVVELMPQWEPGTLQGVPVSIGYTLPISFRYD